MLEGVIYPLENPECFGLCPNIQCTHCHIWNFKTEQTLKKGVNLLYSKACQFGPHPIDFHGKTVLQLGKRKLQMKGLCWHEFQGQILSTGTSSTHNMYSFCLARTFVKKQLIMKSYIESHSNESDILNFSLMLNILLSSIHAEIP